MHSLLKRQLKRLGLTDQSQPPTLEMWQELLVRISQTYTESDQGRVLLEQSLAISSQEMQELLRQIHTTSETKIKREQAQTRTIIDSVLDAVVGMDQSGRIIEWNSGATEIFGWTKADVLGQRLSDIIIPEEYREAHREGIKRFLETGEGHIVNKRFEIEALHRDGHVFSIELAIISVYKEDTNTFYGFIRDITERKQAMNSLCEAKEQAEAAAHMKSEFLATMSHEIRTPMNGVIGMTGLLLETELDAQQRKYAETVRSSGEALLTLINDILDFSKIEAGKLEFEIIDFDLRVALEESLELLAEKAADKGLELVGLVSGNVSTNLRGDPGRLRQILLNLTGNAIKFTQKGEVTVKIHLLNETDQHVDLRFEVSDTGIGIPADVREKLFQPFSQADSSTTRRFGGTGLGLAISRQLIELMNGEIGVDSVPDQGSTFWFTVQLHKQPPTFEAESVSSSSLQGLRLCCVDDHATNLQLLSQFAEDWGMEKMMASTPAEALAMLQENVSQGQSVDLAILDMEMPGMDGLMLARVIKADPRLASVRLVLLTSLGRRGDATAAREAGFSGYLTKPVRKSQLHECLLAVMNQRFQDDDDTSHSSSLITRFSLSETKGQARTRILVADDHRVNQQLAVLMLERLGYRADVVANGNEAIEAVSRVPYSLILMDCHMPEMDGYLATAEIRRREASPRKREGDDCMLAIRHRIPIIAMTANAMQGDREKCLEAGMDDYISKPIKPDQLEAILAKWIPPEKSEALGASSDGQGEQRETTNQTQVSPSALLPEPVDEAVLEEWRSLGGQDFIRRMADQFISDATASVTALEYAIRENDVTQIQNIAHGLKGICRNMGAGPLGELCFLLEEQNASLSSGQLTNAFRELQAEFQRVCQAFNLKNPTRNIVSDGRSDLP